MKDMVKKHELQGKVATHSMRKTFSAKVYKASGNNLLLTQKALNHSNISTTIKYLNVTKDETYAIIREL